MHTIHKENSTNTILRPGIGRILGIFLTIALFGLYLSSCSKDKIDAPEPIRELIADSRNCHSDCPSIVDNYLWRNQTVYIYTCNGPTCNCIVSYYNDKGEKLTMDQGYQYDNFLQEAKLVKHVWKCTK